MRRSRSTVLGGLILLVCSALSGCQEDVPQEDLGMDSELEGVVPLPGDDPVMPDAARPMVPGADAFLSPDAGLPGVRADTVVGWTGPGGDSFETTRRTPGAVAHLQARFGMRTLPLPLRTTNLTLSQYPCTSCHEGTVELGDRVEDAHDNIQPVHPEATGATCATCHVADSVHRLRLAEGATVTMDHAYRLCAQCHSSEARSWAAGAHGKRLVGWSGRRVLMNCTDCHDPHDPAPSTRLPFPGPRIPRTAGGSP